MSRKKSPHSIAELVCIGTGLVALDVVVSSDPQKPAEFFAGGSCGNVLTMLSFLGWQSYPIARLCNNVAADLLWTDIQKWGVKDDFLSFESDGSTPIIIHRILRDRKGFSKHRFEFKNPEDGKYLPSYKPYLSKLVPNVIGKSLNPKVFYFDRINRGSIELAKKYKELGAFIFFEPSSIKDEKGFRECLSIADIIKFSHDRIPDYDSIFPLGQTKLEIQTLGERGLTYRQINSQKWFKVKGYTIENVIDTAGAGDWCTAGIICTLFSSHNDLGEISDDLLKEAFDFGQILSAINCTYEGARGLMYHINHDELLSKIDKIQSNGTRDISFATELRRQVETTDQTSLTISSLFTHQ